MKTIIGPLNRNYSSRGLSSHSICVSHEGLKKTKLIRGPTATFVQNKAIYQAIEWDAKWEQLERAWNQEEVAQIRSKTAQTEISDLKSILSNALSDDDLAFENLKDSAHFSIPKPTSPKPIPKLILKPLPEKPIEFKPRFEPDMLTDLIPWLRRKALESHAQKVQFYAHKFKEAYAAWEKAKLETEEHNRKLQIEWQRIAEKIATQHQNELRQWEEQREEYLNNQKTSNDILDSLQSAYSKLIPAAVSEFFTMILESSDYPECVIKDFKLEYLPDIKTLLIDYSLPSPESIPTLKEVKYIKARMELSERHFSQSEHAKLYDDVLYQITLRTISEVLRASTAEAIESIIFNGWVSSIDRSTGKPINPCVMSLQTTRDEFLAINLSNVEPKLCFKFLKGIGSSKLHSLAGIAPILQIHKDDRRFVSSYEVAHTLEDSYNLATMDWEDFEHLIRELFEKEFSAAGCEVKVTRASRDGGVDAIIFNPDPIHGGKIVIQAKRYTNPVGVSAVRDLYGTVLNEGANKGILVTTSDFGPDSYSFANGKPLTLFNGGNLLLLLEKHGHKARINLLEAKLENNT